MVATLAACSLIFVCMIVVTTVTNSDMPALTGYAASANTTMYSTVYSAFNLEFAGILVIIGIGVVLTVLLVGGFCAFSGSGALSE